MEKATGTLDILTDSSASHFKHVDGWVGELYKKSTGQELDVKVISSRRHTGDGEEARVRGVYLDGFHKKVPRWIPKSAQTIRKGKQPKEEDLACLPCISAGEPRES